MGERHPAGPRVGHDHLLRPQTDPDPHLRPHLQGRRPEDPDPGRLQDADHRRPLRRTALRAAEEPGPLHRERQAARRSTTTWANDVGLIRIQGRARSCRWRRSSRPTGSSASGCTWITVGCSEGQDATAWDTQILRAEAGVRNTGTGETASVDRLQEPSQARPVGRRAVHGRLLRGRRLRLRRASPARQRPLCRAGVDLSPARPEPADEGALGDPSGRRRPSRLGEGDAGRTTAPPEPPGRGDGPGSAVAERGELTIPLPSAFGIRPPVVSSWATHVQACKPASTRRLLRGAATPRTRTRLTSRRDRAGRGRGRARRG